MRLFSKARRALAPFLLAAAGASLWAACSNTPPIDRPGADDDGGGKGRGGAPGGAAGVGGGAGPGPGSGDGGGAGPGGGGPGGSAGGGASLDGLPCDVAAVLNASCVSCHTTPLAGGAPMPLLSLDDLRAAAPSGGSKTNAERAVERMKSASSPMPPGGQLPADAIATIEAWVAAGTPAGSCGDGGAGGGVGPGGAGGAGGAAPVGEGGLPCDVQSFLNARCNGCHSDPPRNGAPMPLTSFGALSATNGAGVPFADRALARLKNGTMPPGAPLSASEFQAFENWVESGAVEGACEPVDDPFDDPIKCSSGQTVGFCDDDVVGQSLLDDDDDDDDGGDCAGSTMNPGLACGSGNCHGSGGEGPRLRFGGTVYRSGHEPDLCRGGPAGGTGAAQVVITDNNGNTFTRTVNGVGNFLLESGQAPAFAFPIRAKVVYQGRERVMNTPQNTGDCNSCHTRDGRNGAPGRVVLP